MHLALACAGALSLLSCAPEPLSLRPTAGEAATLTPRQYAKVYRRWTRHGRVLNFQEFDTVLLVHATLRSPEFQQAFAARYLDAYKIHDPAERQRVQQQEQDRLKEGPAFFLQVESHNYNWSDLSPLKAYWRIVLVDEHGVETVAAKIENVKSRQIIESALYGQELNAPLGRSYYVVFPDRRPDGQQTLPQDARSVLLRIAGPQGKTDLVWNFQ